MRWLTAFATCAALVLSGSAAAEPLASDEQRAAITPGEGRDCFRARSVRSYSIVDDHSIRVRVSPRRSYTLTTSENAADLDWGRTLRLSSDTGWICTGDVRGAVEVTGGNMGWRYAIDTVTRHVEPPLEEPAATQSD